MPRNPLPEIQTRLQHEYIRERKKGLGQAAGLLAQGMYRAPLRAMLEKIAKGDLMTGVAEMARQVLAEDNARHESDPPQYEPGAAHIVGAVCSQHHPNYYDKRVVCRGKTRYRTHGDDGAAVDVAVVKCQTCGEEMKIKVDCEGYK